MDNGGDEQSREFPFSVLSNIRAKESLVILFSHRTYRKVISAWGQTIYTAVPVRTVGG